MQEPVKTQFDFINFVYGVGAAVILVAAMFKFLGWSYANEIFIVGLTTEAVVFLVSAFQWRVERKGYEWEKVFPGLASDADYETGKIDLTESVQQYYKNTDSIIRSVQNLDRAIQSIAKASEELSVSVKGITKNMERIEESSQKYEDELLHMKSRLDQVNEFYVELSKMIEEKSTS